MIPGFKNVIAGIKLKGTHLLFIIKIFLSKAKLKKMPGRELLNRISDSYCPLL